MTYPEEKVLKGLMGIAIFLDVVNFVLILFVIDSVIGLMRCLK